MADYWRKILGKLEKMLDSSDFRVWIEPLTAEIAGHSLVLSMPGASSYYLGRLKKRFEPVIRTAAAEAFSCSRDDVELTFKSVAASRDSVSVKKISVAVRKSEKASSPAEDPVRPRIVAPGLLPQAPLNRPVTGSGQALAQKISRFSFENFVVGPTNKMAFAAAEDVCRAGGCVDTLFLSSGSGLGKTHIAQSVAQRLLRERGDQARVAYLTAEDFYSRFRSGIRSNTLDVFTDQIRGLDFLLLDDVQFLHNKIKTQEHLESLVKYLQNRGSKVVFTSQFQPRELKAVDPQLISLICSGIRADMGLPTFEMRREILQRKASVHQVVLPDEVTNLIASNITGDIRELESCLQTLLLKMRVFKTPLTPEMALEVLAQFGPQASAGVEPSFEDIMHYVSEGFGLTEEQICSRLRRREIVVARNTLFYLVRKHTHLTLQEIGSRVNKRHSTVIKGISAVEHEISSASPSGRQISRVISLIERNTGIAASAL